MSALDWNVLVPNPVIHDCDCDYCEMVGEPEDVSVPALVWIDGRKYISDRYIAVLASSAPVPDDWPGTVLDGPKAIPKSWSTEVLDEPPLTEHFRWSVITAVEDAGWKLRRLGGESRFVAIIDDGEQVGWAVIGKQLDDDDSRGRSRQYAEATR